MIIGSPFDIFLDSHHGRSAKSLLFIIMLSEGVAANICIHSGRSGPGGPGR